MNNALKKIIKTIKKYDRIIITGHKNPDFDSFASSLGMYEICKKLKKEAYVYISLDKINKSLEKGIQALKDAKEIYNLIDLQKSKELIDKDTLLIAMDFCNKKLIENEDLLELDTIIIDHHVIDENLKINSIYELIDNNASSASEIITFFMNQLHIQPSSLVSTLLLVGIEVDTNGYMMKTTSKTFLASSILLDLKADCKIKTEILKETRENYIKKANIIKRSYMVNDQMIICILNNEIYDQKDLAEVADELIQFEDVEASFVIGKIEQNKVSISARSIGNINVQQIMNSLGGGGSQTSAAAQFQDKTIREAKEKLLKIIR